MRAILVLTAASAVFVTLAATAAIAGDDDGNPVIGRAIYLRDNCVGCHGNTGGGGMGPNLRESGPNDDDVRDAVLNGTRTGMPSFRGLLGDRDIEHLIEYINSLESDEEPVFNNWQDFVPSRFPGQVPCCAPPNEPPHTTP